MRKKYLSYVQAGVDYNAMDPLKRMAQIAAKKTIKNLSKNLSEVELSRGESAYVLDIGKYYLASVIEGLGTKCLVADYMYKLTGKTYYDTLAEDTVAMNINDLIVVGAKPEVISAYWAAGKSSWFDDKKRTKDLVSGWAKACDKADVTWGGGETPTLTGVINPETLDFASACFGFIKPKTRLILGDKLQKNDVIVLLESSGIHSNGLSLARKIAEELPNGYKSKISDGRMYGEALLDPTIIYSKLIQNLFKDKIDIHYMVNITGHGWRKLMRATHRFTYRITNLPPVPSVLQFMIKNGPIDKQEAYGNLNMGAGFAVFVPEKNVDKVIKTALIHKIKAYPYGFVEKGPKQVIIEPKNIVFKGESLNVRA